MLSAVVFCIFVGTLLMVISITRLIYVRLLRSLHSR
jgi:hypothetical protein